ncbi:MAG: hypothetical protein HY894_04210 [Deltaproteobacteria bacterium]|nr:hypothetical protein [Deltaproteobacteria bacterium]
MEDGTVDAPSGTVNLVAAASPGEAVFDKDHNLQTGSFKELGLINLIDGRTYGERPVDGNGNLLANVDASGISGAKVYIRGGRLVADNAWIFADTYGDYTGGTGIDIQIAGAAEAG